MTIRTSCTHGVKLEFRECGRIRHDGCDVVSFKIQELKAIGEWVRYVKVRVFRNRDLPVNVEYRCQLPAPARQRVYAAQLVRREPPHHEQIAPIAFDAQLELSPFLLQPPLPVNNKPGIRTCRADCSFDPDATTGAKSGKRGNARV